MYFFDYSQFRRRRTGKSWENHKTLILIPFLFAREKASFNEKILYLFTPEIKRKEEREAEREREREREKETETATES